ncbi:MULTISPECIES: hypothetical protein [Lactobacillus]|jgi:hypothetical protein|uniref:hypothetical protein n=1 Tax=Lactobacillus TaxID=1578 RepID=UPI002493B69E|nr:MULTISPECIES: hypothetical protein [Lactobacillus]
MKKEHPLQINLIYYDLYGNHVGKYSTRIKNKCNLPTHHLKSLIHYHMPYGYQVIHNFVYPQLSNFRNDQMADLYIAVQEQPIYN